MCDFLYLIPSSFDPLYVIFHALAGGSGEDTIIHSFLCTSYLMPHCLLVLGYECKYIYITEGESKRDISMQLRCVGNKDISTK